MTLATRSIFTPTEVPPTFVIDVGVSLEWIRADTWAPEPARIITLLPATVPLVSITWPAQMADGVLILTRSGKVTSGRAERYLAEFDNFKFLIDADPLDRVWPAVLAVARRYRLRVGPAAALELALRSQLPLATVDPRLRTAATRAGVALFAP